MYISTQKKKFFIENLEKHAPQTAWLVCRRSLANLAVAITWPVGGHDLICDRLESQSLRLS
jgi:hypothetical protein